VAPPGWHAPCSYAEQDLRTPTPEEEAMHDVDRTQFEAYETEEEYGE
jgi:hypothetical protein